MPRPTQSGDVVFFVSPSDFRRWLRINHTKCSVLWVGFRRKATGRPSLTYVEAVDEALCFGWIDGVRYRVDAESYTVRFTPRLPRSQWSAVNIKRLQELADSGRVRPAGLKAFEGAHDPSRKYSYEQRESARLNAKEEEVFKSKRKAWDFFQGQPPWYRRTATFWVVSAKKDATRQRRLSTLIDDCAHGRTIAPLTRKSVPKRKEK